MRAKKREMRRIRRIICYILAYPRLCSIIRYVRSRHQASTKETGLLPSFENLFLSPHTLTLLVCFLPIDLYHVLAVVCHLVVCCFCSCMPLTRRAVANPSALLYLPCSIPHIPVPNQTAARDRSGDRNRSVRLLEASAIHLAV